MTAVQTRQLPFALPLHCTACGGEFFAEGPCPTCGQKKMEVWRDLPRLIDDGGHCNGFEQEQLRRVLALMEKLPWQQAVRQLLDTEGRYSRDTSRSDMVYGFPWNRSDTVLEIGAGLGHTTFAISPFVKTIIALEPVPERALFLHNRAQQERIHNIYPIIADPRDMPFAQQSFDVITVNGAFEYIGDGTTADPALWRREFLVRLLQLLRPGGCLYFGMKGHSPLRNLIRWCGGPGGKPAARECQDGVFAWTAKQCKRMLRQAGFDQVKLHGCIADGNHLRAIYLLDDCSARFEAQRRLDAPRSSLGWMRRLLADFGILPCALEEAFLVVASKGGPGRPVAWADMRDGESILQLSTCDKVCLVSFIEQKPASFYKTAKTAPAQKRLEAEHLLLQALDDQLGTWRPALSVRWPQTRKTSAWHDWVFFQYEHAGNYSLSDVLSSWRLNLRKFVSLFATLVHGYVQLAELITRQVSPLPCSMLSDNDSFLSRDVGDEKIRRQVHKAWHKLKRKDWSRSCAHGDLSLANAIVAEQGNIVLIDWENACADGIVALDLIRLLYDTWDEARILRRPQRSKVLKCVRETVRAAWTELGVASEDMPALEALYVSQQAHYLGMRAQDPEKVLRIYYERPLEKLFEAPCQVA